MQNQLTRKRKNDAKDGFFCLFLVLFAIFEVVMLVIVLSRAFGEAPKKPTPPIGNEEQTTDFTDPVPSQAVFLGGVVPVSLFESAATKTLGSSIHSQYAILVNAATGEIVAQKGATAQFEPASMTKVMTLIVACESLTVEDLDKTVTTTQEMYDYARKGAYVDSTCYGIDVDDQYKVRDLLYGIGMESASDCVVPIVFTVAGNEEEFVKMMNDKAKDLKLNDTHFDNAIGHESTQNYTTAADMARIMAYAMQSDVISDILSKSTHKGQASGYKTTGEWNPSFPFTFYGTLHVGRMTTYEKHAGEKFLLDSSKLVAGKTGSFITSSFVVCTAESNSGTDYILVLGAATKEGSKPASYFTMCDIKTVLDTYAK